MTPRTRANLAILLCWTWPFWGTLLILTVLYIVFPFSRWWFNALVWLGTLPFWWVRP